MNLSIDIDVNDVARNINSHVSNRFVQALPELAVREAEFLLERWRAGASGQVYPGMSRPFYSQRYQLALMRTEPQATGDGVEIYVGNGGAVDFGRGPFDFVLMIERGRGPVDLKTALTRGKGKIRKDGQHYLVIPFRHGSGESVHFPSNINPSHFNWSAVQRRPGSAAYGPAERGIPHNPWTHAVERQQHQGPSTSMGVGPRYREPYEATRARFVATGQTHQYEWRRALLSGVQRTGAAGHHQYMTFRTISPESDPAAWILPALRPNPIFESTVRATAPLIVRHVEEALRQQGPMSLLRRLFG